MEDEPGDDTLGVADEADLRVDGLEEELGFRFGEQIEGVALSRLADLQARFTYAYLERQRRPELVGAHVALKHVPAHGDRPSLLGRRRLRRGRNCRRFQHVQADVIRASTGRLSARSRS
jgi:hypothetical protein